MRKIFAAIYFFYRWLIFAPLLGIVTAICGFLAVSISMIGYPELASWFAGTIWGRVIAVLTPMFVTVKGRDKIQPGQSYIVVANHPSAYDIFIIYGWLGIDFKWVIKKEARKFPILGISCEKMRHIFVDRSNTEAAVRSLEEAKDRIKDGVSVMFFPEGTRSPENGGLHNFKKGAFRMAVQLGLPILPVTIIGTNNVLPPKSVKLMPGKAKLIFHDPIDISTVQANDIHKLAVHARDIIAAALSNSEDSSVNGVSSKPIAEAL